MAKRLARRVSTVGKKKEAPEPDTFACKGVETAVTSEDSAPLLGKCTKCDLNPSNSEADHLCLNCHKLANGFEFDEDKNLYVKKRKK